MSHSTPPPVDDRRLALRHLLAAADGIDNDFFDSAPSTVPHEDFKSEFGDAKLTVRKRTISNADPANIVYEIFLNPSIKKGLLVFVLRPKDKDANKAAYKRCLEDLIANKASLMAQNPAVKAKPKPVAG